MRKLFWIGKRFPNTKQAPLKIIDFEKKEVPITAPMRGRDEIFEIFSIDRDNTQLDIVCEDWDSLSEALRGD